jgi:hypothetical protein
LWLSAFGLWQVLPVAANDLPPDQPNHILIQSPAKLTSISPVQAQISGSIVDEKAEIGRNLLTYTHGSQEIFPKTTESISKTGVLTVAERSNKKSQRYLTATEDWVVILNETFEGDFPGIWTLSESGSGEYLWGKRDCRAFEGSHSGWAVGGGADGSPLPCYGNYSNNASSVMEYGPFSLVDASAAELTFKAWYNLALDSSDRFCWGYRTGVGYYSEICNFNTNTGGWVTKTVDMNNGLGQSQVWIFFYFSSNGYLVTSEGAYLDNILLRKFAESINIYLPLILRGS